MAAICAQQTAREADVADRVPSTSRLSEKAETDPESVSGRIAVAVEWPDLQMSVHSSRDIHRKRGSLQQFPSVNSGATRSLPQILLRRGADVHGNGDFVHQNSD